MQCIFKTIVVKTPQKDIKKTKETPVKEKIIKNGLLNS